MIAASASPLSLFAGYGIELEYMIVDRASLDVLAIADKLIHAVAGDYRSEVEQGELAWSNEMVLHVIEIKTNGPAGALEPLPALFQRDITRINELLAPHAACLMPGAIHPWMDPRRDTRLWPHEYNSVYEAYDRIFGCQGHGWSNLQSVHLNLPFAGDADVLLDLRPHDQPESEEAGRTSQIDAVTATLAHCSPVRVPSNRAAWA